MNTYLIAAITLDGFIAKNVGHNSTDWTSPEDKQFFRTRTQNSVIILGSSTYKTIGKPLPGRTNIIYTKNPSSIPDSAPFSNQAHQSGTRLFTTSADPNELLKQLNLSGCSEVAICGGSAIYSLFLSHHAIDTLYLTLEPIVFGTGVSLFDNSFDNKLHLVKHELLNSNTLLLEYQV